MIISFAGLHGSGKSAIASKIAKHFNFIFYSTGMAFRELAKTKNMSLEDFSHFVEGHFEIDRLLDEKIKHLAKSGNSYVFEGQLPAYILQDLNDYCILLTCDESVRVKRMAIRDKKSLQAQLKETIVREESECQRFKKIYDIDILDPEIILKTFNLIIDTAKLNIEEISKICITAIEGINRFKNLNLKK